MSRWAEAFAALSRGSDTLDTVRHSQASGPTVSQSVNTVTPPAELILAPWRERGGQRTGIANHACRILHVWAEGFAQLNPERPLADVPPRRWRCLIDDAGQFLENGFAERAAVLGWELHDLFGCDRDWPFARIDRAGLLWVLDGGRVVALTADTAVIQAHSGAHHVYRRRPAEPERALAWELAP